MDLSVAITRAAWLKRQLSPLCERFAIAGSVRRCRAEVNDIDVVCIPHIVQTTDLFGGVIESRNLVAEWVDRYLAGARRHTLWGGVQYPEILQGAGGQGKQMLVQLHSCRLDIFFASATNWASRLLCRTGSKEHNRWFAQAATDRGYHWFIYEGLARLADLAAADISPSAAGSSEAAFRRGLILPARDEPQLYAVLGEPFLPPEQRERGVCAAAAILARPTKG